MAEKFAVKKVESDGAALGTSATASSINRAAHKFNSPQLKKLIIERVLDIAHDKLYTFIKENDNLVTIRNPVKLHGPVSSPTTGNPPPAGPAVANKTDTARLNSRGRSKQLDECTPARLIKFFDGFFLVHYILEAIKAKFPEVAACPEALQAKLEEHVKKQLDAIVLDGKALIRLHGNFEFDKEESQTILKLINVAVNYDIQYVMSHPAIQSVLDTHGMKSIQEDWLNFILSPMVFLLYPIFKWHEPWHKYIDNPIIAGCFKVYGTALVTPMLVQYIRLGIEYPDNLPSKYGVLSFICLWWVSFIYYEVKQLVRWSSLFNKPFEDFSLSNFVRPTNKNSVTDDVVNQLRPPPPARSTTADCLDSKPAMDDIEVDSRSKTLGADQLDRNLLKATLKKNRSEDGGFFKRDDDVSPIETLTFGYSSKLLKSKWLLSGTPSPEKNEEPEEYDLNYQTISIWAQNELSFRQLMRKPQQRAQTHHPKSDLASVRAPSSRLKRRVTLNPYRLDEMRGKVELYRNVGYLRNFWTKVDWIIILMFFLFFVLMALYSIYPNELCLLITQTFFSIGTMLLLFRVMEHFGTLVPVVGPFVRAFVRIFSITSIFLLIITLVAASCAVMLSNFICRPPMASQLRDLNTTEPAAAEYCRHAFHCNSESFQCSSTYPISAHMIGNEGYTKCTEGIFRYFILEPMDNYGLNLYGELYYGVLTDKRLLKCYGDYVERVVVVTMSFYYLTVIFALMRGVLVKYLLHSKDEESTITAVSRTKAYMRSLFQVTPHPPPWNIIFGFFEIFRALLVYFFKCYKRKTSHLKPGHKSAMSSETPLSRRNSLKRPDVREIFQTGGNEFDDGDMPLAVSPKNLRDFRQPLDFDEGMKQNPRFMVIPPTPVDHKDVRIFVPPGVKPTAVTGLTKDVLHSNNNNISSPAISSAGTTPSSTSRFRTRRIPAAEKSPLMTTNTSTSSPLPATLSLARQRSESEVSRHVGFDIAQNTTISVSEDILVESETHSSDTVTEPREVPTAEKVSSEADFSPTEKETVVEALGTPRTPSRRFSVTNVTPRLGEKRSQSRFGEKPDDNADRV